jgi:fucose 4-O-acetylase-like acetyltransferase
MVFASFFIVVAVSLFVPAVSMYSAAFITSICFLVALCHLIIDAVTTKSTSDPHSEALLNPLESNVKPEPLPAKGTKARLYYLDNIKTLLTFIVIAHHSLAAYSGTGWYLSIGNYKNTFGACGRAVLSLDSSYFMALFFFISGYFTPSSVSRKGRSEFIRDRLRRIALPLGVYTLLIGPCLSNLLSYTIRGIPYKYNVDPGPTWYLLWLLILSFLYVAIPDEDTSKCKAVGCPGWPTLIGFTIPASAVTAGMMIVCGSLLFMPITFGSFPYYLAFFSGGCVARQSNWLEKIPEKFGNPNNAVVVWVLLAIGVFVFNNLVYKYLNEFSVFVPGLGDDDIEAADDSPPTPPGTVTLPIIFGLSAYLGLFCMVFTVSSLQMGALYLNYTNTAWQTLSGAAYPAYIIHPPFVMAFQLLWMKVLATTGNDPEWKNVSDWNNQVNSSTKLSSEWLLVAGWLFTVAGAYLTVWPTAILLKKVPAFKSIL